MLVYEALDIDNEYVAQMIEKRTLLRKKLKKAWDDMKGYGKPDDTEEVYSPFGDDREYIRVIHNRARDHDKLNQDPKYKKLTKKWSETKKEFNRIEARIAGARKNLRIPNQRNRKMTRKKI